MKKLIIYYSYGGNTKKIAQILQKETGYDIAEIKTITPYSDDYDLVVEQGKKEVDKGFLPKIQPLDKSLDDYDTVIIGSPVWWYTFAPAVNTFLKNNDLSNKTVSLFATNGGWVGNTFENFEKECAGANIKKGINIRFDKNILITPEKNIKVWVKEI